MKGKRQKIHKCALYGFSNEMTMLSKDIEYRAASNTQPKGNRCAWFVFDVLA
jgi:hypothetical protein